jgi:hypothetical protein
MPTPADDLTTHHQLSTQADQAAVALECSRRTVELATAALREAEALHRVLLAHYAQLYPPVRAALVNDIHGVDDS